MRVKATIEVELDIAINLFPASVKTLKEKVQIHAQQDTLRYKIDLSTAKVIKAIKMREKREKT